MLHGWVCSAERGLGGEVRESLGWAEFLCSLSPEPSAMAAVHPWGLCPAGAAIGGLLGAPACPSIPGLCALLQLCNAAVCRGWVSVR